MAVAKTTPEGVSAEPADGEIPASPIAQGDGAENDVVAKLLDQVQKQSALLGKLSRKIGELEKGKPSESKPVTEGSVPAGSLIEQQIQQLKADSEKVKQREEAQKAYAARSAIIDAFKSLGNPDESADVMAEGILSRDKKHIEVVENERGGFDPFYVDGENRIPLKQYAESIAPRLTPAKPAPTARNIPTGKGAVRNAPSLGYSVPSN